MKRGGGGGGVSILLYLRLVAKCKVPSVGSPDCMWACGMTLCGMALWEHGLM